MENQDSEATRASPDATTVLFVPGPTLRAPELEMIGAEEPALEPPPAPAAPKEAQPVPDADLAEQVKRLGHQYGMLENAFFYPPFQPQQKAQQKAKQTKEKELPAPAALLFATSTATLSLSKDAIIALVLLFIALAVIGGGVYLCCRSGGYAGGPATA